MPRALLQPLRVARRARGRRLPPLRPLGAARAPPAPATPRIAVIAAAPVGVAFVVVEGFAAAVAAGVVVLGRAARALLQRTGLGLRLGTLSVAVMQRGLSRQHACKPAKARRTTTSTRLQARKRQEPCAPVPHRHQQRRRPVASPLRRRPLPTPPSLVARPAGILPGRAVRPQCVARVWRCGGCEAPLAALAATALGPHRQPLVLLPWRRRRLRRPAARARAAAPGKGVLGPPGAR